MMANLDAVQKAVQKHLERWDKSGQPTDMECLSETLTAVALSAMDEMPEEWAEDGFTWRYCATCNVPIYRHYSWSHQGGTPPTDHDADPGDG